MTPFQIKRAEALAEKYIKDDYTFSFVAGHTRGYAACVADASVLVEALEFWLDTNEDNDIYVTKFLEALKKWRGE